MAVLAPSSLERVREKVEANERLDFEDGLALMESDDVLELGALADEARQRRGGTEEVYFVQNLYLNQTNVCRVKCKFCAFAVTQKQEGAYTYTGDELVEDALRQRDAAHGQRGDGDRHQALEHGQVLLVQRHGQHMVAVRQDVQHHLALVVLVAYRPGGPLVPASSPTTWWSGYAAEIRSRRRRSMSRSAIVTGS